MVLAQLYVVSTLYINSKTHHESASDVKVSKIHEEVFVLKMNFILIQVAKYANTLEDERGAYLQS